jgi:ATP-dependent HslUV protease subunit HslV
MTTVVVVRKAGQIAIAADTLVTFGDTRLSNRYEDNTKIFRIDTDAGPNYIGMAGTVAHFPVLRKALGTMPREILQLSSKDEVFDTFTKLHPYLKDNFFLQTKEEDSDPYESSQFSVVIANASGIYGLYSYREVFEFKEFWGIGSGRSFALGAMHSTYQKAKTAREVAEAGIAAGCEFDRNSAAPWDVFTVKTKENNK